MVEVRSFVLFHDRAFFGEAIPGADFEADVASVNAIANRAAEFLGD